MDERVKEIYQKIYAELFTVILIFCCISSMTKLILFHKTTLDCFSEFLILIGSPIYLIIRTHMLGVTQAPFFQNHSWKHSILSLTAGTITAVAVFSAMQHRHGKASDFFSLVMFGTAFLFSFLLFRILFKKSEEKRQKKLDSQYDDE